MNERLKEVRKALGLNQTDFGGRVGVASAAISKIEKGINNLTEQMILAICREYNVNEDWLRNGNGDMFAPDPATEIEMLAKKYALSDFDKALIMEYASLTDAQRQAVNRFVDKLYTRLNLDTMTETAEEIAPPVYKELSIEEKVELYRKRLEAAERGTPFSMTTEKPA